MRAYISVSHTMRKSLDIQIKAIVDTLDDFNITSIVFVDKYTFNLDQERQMMEQAMIDIDKCDILLAETSAKGIGIGVEVGYAKARGKTIIYLRHCDAAHSTTVSGMSDYQIIYNDPNDLKKQLTSSLDEIRRYVETN